MTTGIIFSPESIKDGFRLHRLTLQDQTFFALLIEQWSSTLRAVIAYRGLHLHPSVHF